MAMKKNPVSGKTVKTTTYNLLNPFKKNVKMVNERTTRKPVVKATAKPAGKAKPKGIDPKAYAARVTKAKKTIASMDPATAKKIKDMYPNITKESIVNKALSAKATVAKKAAKPTPKSKVAPKPKVKPKPRPKAPAPKTKKYRDATDIPGFLFGKGTE